MMVTYLELYKYITYILLEQKVQKPMMSVYVVQHQQIEASF
jgi:hypothetical protein